MATNVGCILQAHHKFPDLPFPDQPWDTPEVIERFNEITRSHDEAHIVTFIISEAQAWDIVQRLWPDEGLLGATSGRGFSIDTADQASVVNEVLAPDIHIRVSDMHNWRLQTWPA
jgi:hypothetical protein